MPLDVTEIDDENGSQSSTRNTSSTSAEPHNPSRISGVREILQRAREARLMNERMTAPSSSARADTRPRRIRGPIPMPLLRSSSAALDIPSPQSTATLNGGRRESPRESVYNESISTIYQSNQVQSTSQIQTQTQTSDSPSLTSNTLLRRELDSDDFPSRLSILRANALLHDDLERAMGELGLPFLQTRRDSVPPRNHHRHSSMSTSPRVLESGSTPTTSARRNEQDLNDKLEDVLFFLDMQRLPSTNLGKLIHLSHFQRSLVAECSWLRPGGRFHGIQSFARETNSLISNLARQLRDSQSASSKEWKVEVVIDQVDYSDMSIAGSMTAYDMPESSDRPSVTTFWTGELIDFLSCHSLLTKDWSATASDDIAHWRRLEPFRDIADESSQKLLPELCEKYILMRWKEQCFVDTSASTGLTILGFYYCSLRREDGVIEGLYWDPSSAPYQRLSLKSVSSKSLLRPGRRSFPVYAFR